MREHMGREYFDQIISNTKLSFRQIIPEWDSFILWEREAGEDVVKWLDNPKTEQRAPHVHYCFQPARLPIPTPKTIFPLHF